MKKDKALLNPNDFFIAKGNNNVMIYSSMYWSTLMHAITLKLCLIRTSFLESNYSVCVTKHYLVSEKG